MDILYLSSLCSVKEYERMFNLFGSTSSHASQKFNRLFVRGLTANGCSVEALTQRILPKGSFDESKSPSECEDGVSYNYLPKYKNSKINRLMTILHTYKYVRKWSKKHPEGTVICDIILGELSLGVWLASKTKKLKTTAIVTDVPSIRAGEKRGGLRALPIKIKNDAIFSYKSYIFLTEQMNEKLNPKNRPYVVIEGLVDKDVLQVENTLQNKYSEKVVMMAGLLEEFYGVDTLAEAFAGVNCPEARMKFYGKGASVEKIKEISKTDSRISYCGELTNSEIVAEEKKATLLINPRPPIGEWTAYSFPSKNMEYMASGTPLVAFDLPCIPDDYKPYFYMIEDYNVESIKRTLENLLSADSTELHLFGKASQKWVTDHKNPEVQVKKYVDKIIKANE